MKKLYLLFIFLILPISVFAKDTCDSRNIKIESITLEDTRGNIEEVSTPSSDGGKIHLDLKMNVVGDSAEYKIVLKNTSDEEYYFDENSLSFDTSYVEYNVQYNDGSNLIKSGEEKVITLKVVYKDKVDSSNLVNGLYNDNQVVKLILANRNISNDILENPVTKRYYCWFIIAFFIIGFIILYKNKNKGICLFFLLFIIPFTSNALCRHTLEIETNLVIDGKEAIFLPGREVNVKMKQLAGDDTSSVTDESLFENQNITSILKSDIEPDISNKEEKNIVSTSDSSYPIYMWYEDGTIYWWSEDETPSLNVNAKSMFSNIDNLVDISGLESFDSSLAEHFSALFFRAALSNLMPLKKWNVSNVKSMYYCFARNTYLTSLSGIENWDTSNVTDMSYIFTYNSSLLSLDGLSNWNVSKLINLKGAFSFCENLESILGLENWDTSNVEDMSFTFNYNLSLKDISPIKNWNVSNVKTMRQLFSSTISLKEADLSNWKTNSLQDMVNLFGMWNSNGTSRSDSELQEINLSGFDTSNVTLMNMTFSNNPKLNRIIGINNLDVSNVLNMSFVFSSCKNMINLDLSNWNTSNVTDMSYMFSGCSSLTDVDLSNWNTSNVTNMSYMFSNTSLAELDISSFDTRGVTNFNRIFNSSTKLKHIYVGENWNTAANTGDATYAFPSTCELPNFSNTNSNYRNLSYAHTGEGGYLTLKID